MPQDLSPEMHLPGVRPLEDARWLRVDEAYAAQMAYRRRLLDRKRDQVVHLGQDSHAACVEALNAGLQILPEHGFSITSRHIYCPDGAEIDREADAPLVTLAKAVQEDICIMQKIGDEHVLTAAVLCFPASWTLHEKADKPLLTIHGPVAEYTPDLAKRVQRLFDGVQVSRPLWRNNMLWYERADLFQPLSENDPARAAPAPAHAPFQRAERQCILRLPETDAVIFSIHSYVVRGDRPAA